ncbi:hypothetical protein VNO78_10217 [Psophocarpus tetragonolobus]|uniref:Uncharacterized protein n=1 Tax=Psophocarpus tetragonolobus TaxID=3891 RepID=A0AAN9SJS3_PSOTE
MPIPLLSPSSISSFTPRYGFSFSSFSSSTLPLCLLPSTPPCHEDEDPQRRMAIMNRHEDERSSVVVEASKEEEYRNDTHLTEATDQVSNTYVGVSTTFGPKATSNKLNGAKRNHAHSRKATSQFKKNSRTLGQAKALCISSTTRNRHKRVTSKKAVEIMSVKEEHANQVVQDSLQDAGLDSDQVDECYDVPVIQTEVVAATVAGRFQVESGKRGEEVLGIAVVSGGTVCERTLPLGFRQ